MGMTQICTNHDIGECKQCKQCGGKEMGNTQGCIAAVCRKCVDKRFFYHNLMFATHIYATLDYLNHYAERPGELRLRHVYTADLATYGDDPNLDVALKPGFRARCSVYKALSIDPKDQTFYHLLSPTCYNLSITLFSFSHLICNLQCVFLPTLLFSLLLQSPFLLIPWRLFH